MTEIEIRLKAIREKNHSFDSDISFLLDEITSKSYEVITWRAKHDMVLANSMAREQSKLDVLDLHLPRQLGLCPTCAVASPCPTWKAVTRGQNSA